nr:hypothetical protein BgiMline_018302 [Biomphalaria glabrata]
MLTQGEEIGKADSYFAYGRSMSIIDRSHFSATCSPNLYTYLAGLLIGQKGKRGLNASQLPAIPHSNSILLCGSYAKQMTMAASTTLGLTSETGLEKAGSFRRGQRRNH